MAGQIGQHLVQEPEALSAYKTASSPTPYQRSGEDGHAGHAEAIVADRQAVLDAAYAAHAERFRRGRPTAAAPPTEAWINKPSIQTTTAEKA